MDKDDWGSFLGSPTRSRTQARSPVQMRANNLFSPGDDTSQVSAKHDITTDHSSRQPQPDFEAHANGTESDVGTRLAALEATAAGNASYSAKAEAAGISSAKRMEEMIAFQTSVENKFLELAPVFLSNTARADREDSQASVIKELQDQVKALLDRLSQVEAAANQAASAAAAAESSMASETEDLCGYVEERLEEVANLKEFVEEQLAGLQPGGITPPGSPLPSTPMILHPGTATKEDLKEAVTSQATTLQQAMDERLAEFQATVTERIATVSMEAVAEAQGHFEGRLQALQSEIDRVEATAHNEAEAAAVRLAGSRSLGNQLEAALEGMQARLDEVAAMTLAAAEGQDSMSRLRQDVDGLLEGVVSEVASTAQVQVTLREDIDRQLETIREELRAVTPEGGAQTTESSEGNELVAALEKHVGSQLEGLRAQLGGIRLEAAEASETATGLQDFVDSSVADLREWVADQVSAAVATDAAPKDAEAVDSTEKGPLKSAEAEGSASEALAAPTVPLITKSDLESQREMFEAQLHQVEEAASEHAIKAANETLEMKASASAATAVVEQELALVNSELSALRKQIELQIQQQEEQKQQASADQIAAGVDRERMMESLGELQQQQLDEVQEEIAQLRLQLDESVDVVSPLPSDVSAASDAELVSTQVAALRDELTAYVDEVASSLHSDNPPTSAAADANPSLAPAADQKSTHHAAGPAEQASTLGNFAMGWLTELHGMLATYGTDSNLDALAVDEVYAQIDVDMVDIAERLGSTVSEVEMADPDPQYATQIAVWLSECLGDVVETLEAGLTQEGREAVEATLATQLRVDAVAQLTECIQSLRGFSEVPESERSLATLLDVMERLRTTLYNTSAAAADRAAKADAVVEPDAPDVVEAKEAVTARLQDLMQQIQDAGVTAATDPAVNTSYATMGAYFSSLIVESHSHILPVGNLSENAQSLAAYVVGELTELVVQLSAFMQQVAVTSAEGGSPMAGGEPVTPPQASPSAVQAEGRWPAGGGQEAAALRDYVLEQMSSLTHLQVDLDNRFTQLNELQGHAAEHRSAVDGLVSFADARLADMQALYLVVEQRLTGMAAAQDTIDDEVRDVRHNAALLAGQIEGLASKIEDLQTAEAVSIGRAARAAQATELHMQEATEAIGGQLKVQLETSMADERRALMGVGSRGGYTAEVLVVLMVLGLVIAVALHGDALRDLSIPFLRQFAPLT